MRLKGRDWSGFSPFDNVRHLIDGQDTEWMPPGSSTTSTIAQVARVMAKQYREEVGPWVPFMPVLTDRETPRS